MQIPGGRARRAGRAAEGARDHGARRGLPCRARGGLLVARDGRRGNWRVDRRLRARDVPRLARRSWVAGWTKAVARAKGWGEPGSTARPCVPLAPAAERCIYSHNACTCTFNARPVTFPVDSPVPLSSAPPPYCTRLRLRPAAPRDARADAALRRSDGAVGTARHAVLAAAHARFRRADLRSTELAEQAPARPHRAVAHARSAARRAGRRIAPGRDARTREVR